MLKHVLDHVTGRTRPTSSPANTGQLLAIAAVAVVATACSTSRPTPPPPVQAPTPTTDATTAAALGAYGEFWRISEQAFAAPTARDWRAELGKVARGQAFEDTLADVRTYAGVPAHLEGRITRSAIIDPGFSPAANRVDVLDCVDVSNSKVVTDKDGINLSDTANQVPRYRYRAQVLKDQGGSWLVEKATAAVDEPC